MVKLPRTGLTLAGLRKFKVGELWILLKRQVRLQCLRLLREPDSVHRLALGVACGVFVGFLPVIPFQSVIVLALAFLLRANKLSAWLATFISNPINMIPFYAVLYAVGRHFVHTKTGIILDEEHLTMRALLHRGTALFGAMMVGGLVLGIPSAIASYFATSFLVTRYRKRRMARVMKAWHLRQENPTQPDMQPEEPDSAMSKAKEGSEHD